MYTLAFYPFQLFQGLIFKRDLSCFAVGSVHWQFVEFKDKKVKLSRQLIYCIERCIDTSSMGFTISVPTVQRLKQQRQTFQFKLMGLGTLAQY